MENAMEIFQKLKIDLPYNLVISLMCIYSKELKSVCERDLHFHVYCSTIHDSQDIESIWLPTNRWRKFGTYTHWNIIHAPK